MEKVYHGSIQILNWGNSKASEVSGMKNVVSIHLKRIILESILEK
jgi:hypothetical protein